MKTSSPHFIEQLDSKFLSKLAGMFGDEHERLGTGLNVKVATVSNILHDHNQPATRTLKILQNWRNTSDNRGDSSAMYDELCSVFSDCGRTDIVELIRHSKWISLTRLNNNNNNNNNARFVLSAYSSIMQINAMQH